MSAPAGWRSAVVTAVCGTVFIAAGAFWLSYTALADLAVRSGIGADQAWAWPLIVDGLIVVGTVAVVAQAGQPGAWYPWLLLIGGAVVSVSANAIHAIVAADADVPSVLAATVAAVPPIVLLAITHLTVILTHTTTPGSGDQLSPGAATAEAAIKTAEQPIAAGLPSSTGKEPPSVPSIGSEEDAVAVAVRGQERRVLAAKLREQGWSNKAVARRLGVHPSTVGRWFAPTHQADDTAAVAEEAIQ